MSAPLKDRKILVVGGTGQILGSATVELAKHNEVWCVGRFGDDVARAQLEAQGITCVRWTLGEGELAIPEDFTHVIHGAPHRGEDGDFDRAIGANCVGAGMVMTRCCRAKAFVYVSTVGVYSRLTPEHPHQESDPTGGDATHWTPTYGISKVAAEGTVRAYCRTLGLPTTIARMNVGMGPTGWGGMPVRYFRMMLAREPLHVPRDHDTYLNPIHADDITRQVPLLWEVAAVPATIVNWAGDETVTERELIAYISELTGVEANLVPNDIPTRIMWATDNTRRRELIGECRVGWREGVARTLEAHFPGSVKV